MPSGMEVITENDVHSSHGSVLVADSDSGSVYSAHSSVLLRYNPDIVDVAPSGLLHSAGVSILRSSYPSGILHSAGISVIRSIEQFTPPITSKPRLHHRSFTMF